MTFPQLPVMTHVVIVTGYTKASSSPFYQEIGDRLPARDEAHAKARVRDLKAKGYTATYEALDEHAVQAQAAKEQ